MVVTIRQTVSSGSLPPAHTHLLSADENRAGWGSGDRVESAVGGGVGLLERVIFFFQRGERRTVMCAELMTKGPFMCSVCR